jgi:succinyl-CoA synthetase beta subunit
LSALERAEQIAEWVALTVSKQEPGDKPVQVEQVSKGGRGRKGGVSAATKEIGVSRASSIRFRHFISGSLSLVSLNLT